MKTVNFELNDVAGRSHAYQVTLFSCDENLALQLIVAGLLAGPLGKVVGAISNAVAGRDEGAQFDLMETIESVDWASLGGSIQEVTASIEARGGPELFNRVLSKTRRGRFEVDGTGGEHEIMDDLNNATARDLAYAAEGNMLELWKAFVVVLAVNFGPFGRNGSLNLTDALSGLTSWLPIQRIPNTETPAPNTAPIGGPKPAASS
jgi:hypothetical protein